MSVDKNYERRSRPRRRLLIQAAVLLGTVPMVGSADIVTDWSAVATEAVVTAGAGAVDFAIVHVAMYDAVNAIERRYETYEIDPSAPTRDASPEAAAAAAAYHTLVGLFPAEVPALDAAYGCLGQSQADYVGYELSRTVSEVPGPSFMDRESGPSHAQASWHRTFESVLLLQRATSSDCRPDAGTPMMISAIYEKPRAADDESNTRCRSFAAGARFPALR